MNIEELDYSLPTERIATHPAVPRDSAKLMVIHRASKRVEHCHVRDLPRLLSPTDVMIVNESRVLPARFHAIRSSTGGKVGGLYLSSPQRDQWSVLLESRGTLLVGEHIQLTEDAKLTLLEKQQHGQWLAQFQSVRDTLTLLQAIGQMPLPPYIRAQRKAQGEPEDQAQDQEQYNTIYSHVTHDESSHVAGSVAAPTAGLHFTPELLTQLSTQGITRHALTLHVGMGTFAPVRTQRVEDHPIHSEWLHIPAATIAAVRQARAEKKRLVVVGTTSVRAIESFPIEKLSSHDDFITDTKLFIYPASENHPGFPFQYTDVLMTNFHLPKSTLLALVAALPGVGLEQLKKWYEEAITHEYRFYSFGDAMLLLP